MLGCVWLAILILAPIGIIGHGYYFSYCISQAFTELAPRTKRAVRALRRTYLVLTYSLPTLIALWVIYVIVAAPERANPPVIAALDYLVVIPFWLVTVYSAQCTLIIAPLYFVHWILQKSSKAPWWLRRARNTAVVIVAIVFALFVPLRIALDSRTLEVRQFIVKSKNLPKHLYGYRIALVSDPQADQHTDASRIAQLVDAVNAQHPDLVLIAGDIITSAPEYTPVAAQELGKLRAKNGIVSCIGDHDNFAFRDRRRSVRHVKDALQAKGIRLLDNEIHHPLKRAKSLAVVVVTDNYITPVSEAAAERLMVASRSSDYRIVLAHQASERVLGAAQKHEIDLFLGGHTHGGQVNFWFPFFQPVMARIETPYITGRHSVGNLELIVSSGLGVSVFPFRYRAPATVEIITLQATTAP